MQPLAQTSNVVDNTVVGVLTMLLSVILFAVMDATVKWLGGTYPTQQIVFFRSAVAFVPIMLFMWRDGGIRIPRTQRPWMHCLRSLAGLCAMGCAFYGLSVMPLADALSVFYAAPLFITALSVPMLRERVGARRWAAVSIGFIGVLIVVRPGSAVFTGGGIYMLIAAASVAVTTNIIRMLSSTDDAITITFYFTLSGTIVGSVACLWLGWVTPTPADLALLCAVGLLGGCAQYAMTSSVRRVEVSVLAPLKYLSIPIGGFIGYMVWSEIPDNQTLVGIGVIIASGLYTMRREAKLARVAERPLHAAEEFG